MLIRYNVQASIETAASSVHYGVPRTMASRATMIYVARPVPGVGEQQHRAVRSGPDVNCYYQSTTDSGTSWLPALYPGREGGREGGGAAEASHTTSSTSVSLTFVCASPTMASVNSPCLPGSVNRLGEEGWRMEMYLST